MYLSYFDAKDFGLIRFLAEQVFSFPITDIQRLPGTTACNYEVNHSHIFKLPHEYTRQEDWLHQAQLAPVLQSYLTFQIPHPNTKVVRTSDGSTLLSSSYPKIKGICLDDSTFTAKKLPFKKKFFEQLSDAAAQIHSIPLQDLPFQLPTKTEYLENCFFKNSKRDDYLPKKLFRKLLHNSFLGLGESGLKTSLLVHTDLHSENILLNDKDELVAVLDFDTLIRGDHFLEFRPNLYPDPFDLRLFRKIYQERTGVKIDTNDLYRQETAQTSLSWFYHLYQLYRFLPIPDRNKKMKSDFKKKIASEKQKS